MRLCGKNRSASRSFSIDDELIGDHLRCRSTGHHCHLSHLTLPPTGNLTCRKTTASEAFLAAKHTEPPNHHCNHEANNPASRARTRKSRSAPSTRVSHNSKLEPRSLRPTNTPVEPANTPTMPTQRPFLSNFLAAFRSHTQPLPKSVASISSTSAAAASTSTQTVWTSQPTKPQHSNSTNASENAVSHPRPINSKGQNHHASSATAQPREEKHLHPSLQHNVTPQTHLPRSSPTSGLPVYGPPNKPQPSYPTVQESRRARRGSDSSCDSGGFRDVRGGGEKWFIGGKTASGEEKYYKLSMVTRDRSADRISTDQLSL